MDKVRSLSIPASPKETVVVLPRARSLPTSPTRALSLSPSTSFHSYKATPITHLLLSHPTPPGQKRKKYFPGLCLYVKWIEKDLSAHKKVLLGLVFKICIIDGKICRGLLKFPKCTRFYHLCKAFQSISKASLSMSLVSVTMGFAAI